MSKIFFEDLELPGPDIYPGIGSGTHAEPTTKAAETVTIKSGVHADFDKIIERYRGTILIGVSDKREIRGVQIAKKTVTGSAEYIKRNTDPQIFPEIKVREIDNKKTISIKVAESTEKPAFFKSYAYKRVGDTNQRISSSEIRRLVKESGDKTYWDEQICEEARRERNLNIPIDTPVNEVLMRLNASILLFAKEPQNFFLQAEVRCVRFEGNEPSQTIY